jgi:zinc protease
MLGPQSGKGCRGWIWFFAITHGFREEHMRRFFVLWGFLMTFLVSGFTPSLAGESTMAWPWEASDLSPDSRLHYGRLENGFRYVLFPNDHPRGRVHMHLFVQAGSRHEAEGQEGLAHFLEHMAFNGSTHFPPGSLIHFFQEIGMNFGGDTNAHTAFDRTVYDIVLPEGKPETLARGLQVMADYAGGLLLPPEEIVRERGIVLAEKRDRDSAAYRMQQAEQAFLFQGTRIPERPPIGLESVIEGAGQAEFRAFYDTWYRPERMVLFLVGEMDRKAVEEEIRLKFAPLRSRAPAQAEPDLGESSHQGLKFFYHAEPGSGGLQVAIGKVEPLPFEAHTLASEEASVLRYMAMRLLGLRLERLKERPDTPFLSAVAYTHDLYGRLRMTDMRAACDPEHWEAALALLTRTLREALVQGFTQAELDRVRGELVAWFESQAAAAARRESGAIAASLLRDFYGDNVPVAPETMAELILPFLGDVPLSGVNRTFRELWGGNHRLVRLMGEGLSSQEVALRQAMRRIYLEAGHLDAGGLEERGALLFPYLPPPLEKNTVQQVWEDEGLGIRDVLYADGTLLHIKATDFEPDRVRMRVRFGTGRAGEPWPGLSFLAADTLNFSGTSVLTQEDLNTVLAGKRVSLRFGMDVDHHFFDGEARRAELGDLLHLLRAQLEDPGFREEAFSLVRARYLRGIREAAGSVDKSFERMGPCFFTGGDPRFCPPEEGDLSAWTVGDIAAWLGPVLASAPLEISLVGAVDPDAAMALVGNILGMRAVRGDQSIGVPAEAPAFPEGGRMEARVKASPPASLVQWGFPVSGEVSSLRHRGLNLLSGVLKERLREEIRENLGAAYSPFSYYWAYPLWSEWGGIMAGVSLAPDQVELVGKNLLSLARDLGDGALDGELLERVRGPLLNSLVTRQQDNRYWLYGVLDGSVRWPEQRNWARTLLEDYKAWTDADLRELAREVLDPQRASLLHIRTEE